MDDTEPFANGYHFPPKYPWYQATRQFLATFWKFFTTIKGFLITLYGLNVVAWGGMLFLLLCNASPWMCRGYNAQGEYVYDCNNIEGPRRKWVEYDSQILNALFCVTGFGLIPWRFRDLYYLLQYRALGKYEGLQRLAGIHRSWIRLPGSQELPVDVAPDNIPADAPMNAIPVPPSKIPKAPRTGVRAPPTKLWKLDFMIWCMVWNTFAQACLSGVMWGLNRYDRPSWTTGFLVAVACIIAIVGGVVQAVEGSHVKAIEGVKVTEQDLMKLEQDKELGIPHFNNIKDKKPKEPKEHKEPKEKVKIQETKESTKSSTSNE